MSILHRLWREEDGVLSFEWTLLLTLLTIGIVSGLSAARDAIIDELGDVAQAAQAFDQSYSLAAVSVDYDNDGTVDFSTNASVFLETSADRVFSDCGRTSNPGQTPQNVEDSPS
jgi:Flp pilus assembly pilin Flp